jgi:hypothetical protein
MLAAESLRSPATVIIAAAEIVSESIFGVLVDVRGRRAIVPRYELLRGTTIVFPGERGTIVLRQEFAERVALA